jgi:hypothetical protein
MDVTKLYQFISFGPWMTPDHINLYALVPWMSPNLIILYALVDVTKPYNFLGLGARYVTKPYEFDRVYGPWMSPNPINLCALGPCMTPDLKFIRFGAMDVTKSYRIICFGRCHQTP